MTQLLWEVGCEELPAWACEQLRTQLPELVSTELAEARLVESNVGSNGDGHGQSEIRILVGPRRFAVQLDGVLTAQVAFREEKRGPAERAAFADGTPTKACEGFARSMGLTADQLEIREGFVWGVRDLPAQPFKEVWPSLADRILQRINFAKPMKWGSAEHRFVRPIRWIVTLLDNEPVEYNLWGVPSGNTTRTHRFLGDAREVGVSSASAYEATLADGFVVADQSERRSLIIEGLNSAAVEFGGEWFDPGNVLREVVHLVEQPTVIVGRFADTYLQLPERVLVTAMQSHQRYLPVRKGEGLAPAFLTVMNGDPHSVASILPGYERVLAGRLDDAVFSFDRDQERGLADMASGASLGAVMFHAKAGSLAQRRDRIVAVAKHLASQCNCDVEEVERAAYLAKADQVSVLVQEFAELEGFAGSLYAKDAGEPMSVCIAIDQQFLPRSADGVLPSLGVPAVVALADKVELLTTMFAIGEQPTGSRDPHGLRRAAIGIMRIILELDLEVDVVGVLRVAGGAVTEQGLASVGDDLISQLRSFIDDRVERSLIDDGVSVDSVRSARAASLPQLAQLVGLARTLDSAVRDGAENFLAVVTAVTRCKRILEKAGDDKPAGAVDASLFESDVELQLATALDEVAHPLKNAVLNGSYADAVALAAGLGPAVDRFFDRDHGVMVMADDSVVRANRLAVVNHVVDVLSPLGDLTQLHLPG